LKDKVKVWTFSLLENLIPIGRVISNGGTRKIYQILETTSIIVISGRWA
jgi:hypothetical protein